MFSTRFMLSQSFPYAVRLGQNNQSSKPTNMTMPLAVPIVALLLLLWPSASSTDAFVPKVGRVLTRPPPPTPFGVIGRGGGGSGSDRHPRSRAHSTMTPVEIEVPSQPIAGMKPGTSGLRKKVEVWQGVVDPTINKNYVENFIQSLIDTAAAKNNNKMLQTLIVAGDGRYFNTEAITKICHVLAGNGVRDIWVPQHGIMSTPAVSAAIRTRTGSSENDNGEKATIKAEGGIILTASHNPGGPGEDFGIKYNEGYGQPAGEDFTDELYERSLKICSFKTLQDNSSGEQSLPEKIDLSAPVGTTFRLTPSSTVTIIDPYKEYVDVLKECFDFDAMKHFASSRPDFQILFDGMHGAGGPFARRVLMEELGFPEVRSLIFMYTMSIF
jgi:phosphoglucomutase